MARTTIDRLIINSPYEGPKYYWDRRSGLHSSLLYFVPWGASFLYSHISYYLPRGTLFFFLTQIMIRYHCHLNLINIP
jgi:hypothetical protein